MKILTRRWWLAAAAAVAVVASAVGATVASAGAGAATANPGSLGPISGLLPRDHLTLESAIQVNLSKESIRLPLYPGTAYAGTPHAEKVWYVLLDASDPGLAHDLGVNYAPKLANIAIGDPAAVQTVTLTNPTVAQNPFGPGVVNFADAPNFAVLGFTLKAPTANLAPPAPTHNSNPGWPVPAAAGGPQSWGPPTHPARHAEAAGGTARAFSGVRRPSQSRPLSTASKESPPDPYGPGQPGDDTARPAALNLGESTWSR